MRILSAVLWIKTDVFAFYYFEDADVCAHLFGLIRYLIGYLKTEKLKLHVSVTPMVGVTGSEPIYACPQFFDAMLVTSDDFFGF